jgi:hypothetical protein
MSDKIVLFVLSTLGILLIVFVSLLSNQQVFSQTPSIVHWKKYVDDNGEFTIKYPAEYKVIEVDKTETDGTNINGVIFQSEDSVYVVYISKYNYATPKLKDDQDYLYHLKQWWNATTELSLSGNDTSLVKPPEFKNYTLDGKQAGSIIFKITSKDGKIHDVLQVGRILNNGDLVLSLGTLEQRFGQELPQMKHIIESMEFATNRYDE